MTQKYTILTHKKAGAFVDSLDPKRRARVDRIYFLFEAYGRFLPAKYLKKIDKNLWELRPGDVRLFLKLEGTVGFVVHGILKKSQKTPLRDLKVALKRAKE